MVKTRNEVEDGSEKRDKVDNSASKLANMAKSN
jgi:hypothetical protein